jgi:D-apiose dehydrogenase
VSPKADGRRKEPLAIALAGAGMISAHHLTAWRSLGARVRVVAICDPDVDRAAKRAEAFGIPATFREREAMLDTVVIDALDIATPRETHADWVEAAAARGIDVLCQKPLTPTLAEAEALIRRVDGRIRLMVHENWRFRPWYRQLKAWLDAGELGELQLATMAMVNSGFLPDAAGTRFALMRQPFMQHEKRLMIAEVLIHHLDVMRYLCGPLRVVGARASRTVADITGETLATIFLETASGAPILVNGTMAAPGYPIRVPDRLELVGSKASAAFSGSPLTLRGGNEPREIGFDDAGGYQASFDAVMAHFVDCLIGGARFETDPADNLETLRLVEHAYWAAGLHAGQ